MNAEIIAVGSEMLTPERVDTNSLFLTEKLNDLGVELVMKCVIGDDRERLADAVRRAASRSEIVILSGGLGPTEDDVTREAVALAFDRKLVFHPEIADALQQRFARAGRRMAEVNKRQAHIIEGAEILANDRGTAPGQWLDAGVASVMLLPGPPHELKAMFTRQCLPRLERLVPKQVIRTVTLRVAGMAESDLDQLIAPVYTKYSNPATTILAAAGDIQVHLRARCATEADAVARLAEVGGPIELLLGDRIYSRNGDPLEAVVGDLLRKQGATLAVAESCTGGLLGERITNVVGSSEYFLGGYPCVYRGYEDGAAGRSGRDAGAVHGCEPGNSAGHGGRGAAAHRIDICPFHHRSCRTGRRIRGGTGRDRVRGACLVGRLRGASSPVFWRSGPGACFRQPDGPRSASPPAYRGGPAAPIVSSSIWGPRLSCYPVHGSVDSRNPSGYTHFRPVRHYWPFAPAPLREDFFLDRRIRMNKLLLLAFAISWAAPASQVCAGVSNITSTTECTLGNLTFSNFVVDQAPAPIVLMDAAKDPAGHQGEVVLDLNPQTWAPAGAFSSYWFTFQVAGGVQGMNLSVGGTNAMVTSQACPTPINVGGGCSGGGTVLGQLTGTSGQNTQNVKFSSTNPIYVATNVNVGNMIHTSELTSLSMSFSYGNGSGSGGGGQVPEPDSTILLGSGLIVTALLLKKHARRSS